MVRNNFCFLLLTDINQYSSLCFHPTASGPKQCNICLESNAASCTKNQQTAICATNRYSMGTSHCGSAVGKYKNKKGDVEDWFIRGCINCAGKQTFTYTKKGWELFTMAFSEAGHLVNGCNLRHIRGLPCRSFGV